MSKKVAKEYLKHIFDEICFVLDKKKDFDEDRFMNDEVVKRAFVRSLEVVGEAVKNIDEDFKDNHKEINWKSLAGLRDKLIHHYFGVDYQIVWDVIENELPEMKTKIGEILGK